MDAVVPPGPCCLFFDIDGTIARNEQPPSAETVRALHTLQKAGHRVVICTGRTMCDIYTTLLDVGFDAVIAGAGSHVVAGGGEVYHGFLPTGLLRQTVAGMLQHGFSGVLEGTGNIYLVPGKVPLPAGWPHLAGLEEVGPHLEVEKFTIHTTGHAHIEEVLQTMPLLRQYYETYPSNSGGLCEFVLKGRNKAFGMDRALEHFGISRKNSIAFGDSMNDEAMLRHAAVGVAMGDAPQPLRALADYVTAPLEEEGVAAALLYMGML